MWKEIKLPCGHVIEERGKYCPACFKTKARIKNGVHGLCPECNIEYKTNKDGFYYESKMEK